MTASSAAACVLQYFYKLKTFPRSNWVSRGPFFKANHPVFPQVSDSDALLQSPIVLNDVDKQKLLCVLAKSHEISHFSISADLKNRFSQNFDLFIPSEAQMNA
jgi:hypothetical protein